MDRPPERIEVNAILLRRLNLEDVPALTASINECLDHLRPWMPWARVTVTEDDERAFVEGAGKAWDAGTDFGYGVFESGVPIGGVGLSRRIGPNALEIGYWIHEAHTRKGYATAAAGAMTDAAFALDGTNRVEIHCDEANQPSAGVARKLGYRLDRIVDWPIDAAGQ